MTEFKGRMRANIYKGQEVIGTVELKKSKLIFNVKNKEEFKKIKDLYTKPYETSVLEENLPSEDIVLAYKRVKFKPKTTEHFEALSSELWKFGYGCELER